MIGTSKGRDKAKIYYFIIYILLDIFRFDLKFEIFLLVPHCLFCILFVVAYIEAQIWLVKLELMIWWKLT